VSPGKRYRIPKRCSVPGCPAVATIELGRGVQRRPRRYLDGLYYRLCWKHYRGFVPTQKKVKGKTETVVGPVDKMTLVRRILRFLRR